MRHPEGKEWGIRFPRGGTTSAVEGHTSRLNPALLNITLTFFINRLLLVGINVNNRSNLRSLFNQRSPKQQNVPS